MMTFTVTQSIKSLLIFKKLLNTGMTEKQAMKKLGLRTKLSEIYLGTGKDVNIPRFSTVV